MYLNHYYHLYLLKIGIIMARDHTESIEKKYAKEALDRKAKPRIPFCYKCSIRWAKLWIKKEPLIKQVTCENCGRTYKTNLNKIEQIKNSQFYN